MAEATATEEKIPESTAQNLPDSAEPTGATGQVTEGGKEITTPAVTDAKPVGTDGEAGEFKLEDLKEWQEAFKEGAPSGEVGATKLPGKTVEEFEAEARTRRNADYRWHLEQSQPYITQKLQDDYGLTREQAAGIYQQLFYPSVNGVHALSDDYHVSVLDEVIRGALPEAEAKLFFDRKFTNRSERMQALVAIGKELANREWAEKVTKGEYVPGVAVKKIGQAAYAAGRGKGENGATAARSGNNPSTSGAGTRGGWTTKEEARNLHVLPAGDPRKLSDAEMRIINADPSIPEGYGR